MQHPDPVPIAVVLHQPSLLVDTLQLVLGLDQADGASRPADRLQVLHQLAKKEQPGVRQSREPQASVVGDQQRHHDLVHHLLDRGDEIQPADAGEVGLHEPEGVLPDGVGVIHHAVEAVEHGVPRLHRGRPAGAQPLVFGRLQSEQLPNGRVCQVELGQPKQGVVERPGDGVEVDQLFRQQSDGAGQNPDGLHPPVVEVLQVAPRARLPHGLVRGRELRGGQVIERLSHARGQASAAKSRGLDGRGLGWSGSLVGHDRANVRLREPRRARAHGGSGRVASQAV